MFISEGDELENFPLLSASLSHHLQYYIRLLGFGYVDGVELLVIEVDAIFVVRFAHLAEEGSPIDGHAEIVDHCLDLLRQPLLEAEEVDVPHGSRAFAGGDQRVCC